MEKLKKQAMKSLIICVSVYRGNTRKVAEAMAEVLNAPVLAPEEVSPEKLNEYDLIGFGSGIYFHRHHPELLKFVKSLPPMSGKKAFMFYTSGFRRIKFFHECERALRNDLLNKGFDIVGTFSCRGYDAVGPLALIGGISKGHPNEQDLESARKFARELLVKYEVKRRAKG